MIGLTETCLKPDEFVRRLLLLVTIVTISTANPAKAEVLLTNFNLQRKKTAFSSFEHLVMKSMQPTQSLFIATVTGLLGRIQCSSLSFLKSYWTL